MAARSPARSMAGPEVTLILTPHLVGHHMRQGGLAQTGRPIKEHMVERFAALAGGRDQNAEVFLDILLPDQVRERLRAQGLVEAVVRFRFGVQQAFG
jgi:hypothetical protein